MTGRSGIHLLVTLAAIALTLSCSVSAEAQGLKPRVGLGIGTMLTTTDQMVGVGFRLRASAPVNADLSFAVDGGAVGFVFGGRDEASFVLDPQISAIVTIKAGSVSSPYFIGGAGGYFPIGSKAIKDDGGPTLHAGIGWVWALQATSLYFEINPTLVVAKASTHLVLPLRLGIVL